MKIAICDDCQNDIIYLEQFIKSSILCPASLAFYEFHSGEDLMANFDMFDAIFLDIQMQGGMNGAKTAEEIRKHDSEVLLSFYSSLELPARQIIQVQPFGYLMKQFNSDEFSLNIDAILKELGRRKDRPRIHAVCDGKAQVLQLMDVIYISIFKRGCEIWLTKEKAAKLWEACNMPKVLSLKSNIKINDYYAMLNDYGFATANKSYIVNMMHIIAIEKNSILLCNGQKLSVTRSKKREFDDAFSEYMGVQYHRERIK